MTTGTILFALQNDKAPAPDAPDADKEKKGGGGGFEGMLVPIALMAVMFYLLIIVPNKKERQRQAQLLNGLKKNDEVLTTSGILGIVTSIKEGGDEVTIRSDETRLRVLKSSIARIVNPKETPAAPDATAANTDGAKKDKA